MLALVLIFIAGLVIGYLAHQPMMTGDQGAAALSNKTAQQSLKSTSPNTLWPIPPTGSATELPYSCTNGTSIQEENWDFGNTNISGFTYEDGGGGIWECQLSVWARGSSPTSDQYKKIVGMLAGMDRSKQKKYNCMTPSGFSQTIAVNLPSGAIYPNMLTNATSKDSFSCKVF